MRYPREWLGVEDCNGLVGELVQLSAPRLGDGIVGVRPLYTRDNFLYYCADFLRPLTPAAREALAIARGWR